MTDFDNKFFNQIYVVKRNGHREIANFGKVDNRLNFLNSRPYQLSCNASFVAQKVRDEITDGISTVKLDEHAAKVAAELGAHNPEFLTLAARIAASNHQKNTSDCFSNAMEMCYRNKKMNGRPAPRINAKFYKFVQIHKERINKMIDYQRDFMFSYFGFTTLMDRYLIKRSGPSDLVELRPQDYVIERPQDMWMRVACAIHMNRCDLEDESVLDDVLETYNGLSLGKIMHATPTLYNAGTECEQALSCFPAGTKVFTTNVGAINIEDVEIGDEVVTHMGRKRKVVQLHKNPILDRRVFEIKCYMTPEFRVTDNHKVWSISEEQLKWGDKPKWNAIEYLRMGDYIAIPKYEGSIKESIIDVNMFQQFVNPIPDQDYSYRNKIVNENGVDVEYTIRTICYKVDSQGIVRHIEKDNKPLKRYIKVDVNFAKFLGIWYGDGHIATYKKWNDDQWITRTNGIGVTAHSDNKELIDFVEKFSNEYFGVPIGKSKAKNQNCVKISIHCPHLGEIFENLFGKYFDGKIMWEQICDWHIDLLEPFLIGLISTDGCVSKGGNVTLTMSNPNLTEQLYHICRRAGILASLHKINMTKLSTCHAYTLHFSQDNPLIKKIKPLMYKTYTDGRLQNVKTKPVYNPYKVIDDQIFVRIMNKNPVNNFEDKFVYTLGVEEDHSYSIAGIVAQNCFLLGGHDSIEGISKIKGDMMKISKYSGGIGFWWDLRCAGSEVQSTNGKSDGPIPFLRATAADMLAVNQGGKRPGSAANYMEPTHPDFMQWVKLKRSGEVEAIDSLFYACWIPDEFMRRVETDDMWYFVDPHEQPKLYNLYGDEWTREYMRIVETGEYTGEPIKARAIMVEICRTQTETGIPYVLFKDACNLKSNQKNIGTIKSSNLCVAGDTPILTSGGWIEISKLADQVVSVWNGCEFSDALVKQTSESAELFELETSDGCILRCTANHEFLVPQGAGSQHVAKVAANMLTLGQKLAKIPRLPVIENGYDSPLDKFIVPVNYNLRRKLEWLADLIDAVGVFVNGSIQITSIDRKFLFDIKLMCQTLGINPKVNVTKNGTDYRKSYMILISEWDTWKLYRELNMTTSRIEYNIDTRPDQDTYDVTITKIEKMPEQEKTYCFGEPKRNRGMFCGLLTGQCSEILEYSSHEEYACCCVSSICLPKYVVPCDCADGFTAPTGHVEGHQQGCNGKMRMDYDDLAYWSGVLVRNLNKIIDINFYPVPEARRSNLRHRPLALGCQGLADQFILLRYPFTSTDARAENKRTFETIYWGALKASNELAKRDGAYETFLGDPLNNPDNPDMKSPFAEGILQFDMWGLTDKDLMGRWDWTNLKKDIKAFGTRNSLLTSLPPTASTSHIQSNNEAFEPYTDNLYVRKTLSGENMIINHHLIKDLVAERLWTSEMRAALIEHRGSVQKLNVPQWMKELYKTVWELDGPTLVDMDAERAPFIDQTMSSNRFMLQPTLAGLTAMHMRCWRRGLKTGMYYLRSQSASKAKQFSETVKKEKQAGQEPEVCRIKRENGVICYSCQ